MVDKREVWIEPDENRVCVQGETDRFIITLRVAPDSVNDGEIYANGGRDDEAGTYLSGAIALDNKTVTTEYIVVPTTFTGFLGYVFDYVNGGSTIPYKIHIDVEPRHVGRFSRR